MTKLGTFGSIVKAPIIKSVKGGIQLVFTIKPIKGDSKDKYLTLFKYIDEKNIAKSTDFVKFLTGLKPGQYVYLTYNQHVVEKDGKTKIYNQLDQIRDNGFGQRNKKEKAE